MDSGFRRNDGEGPWNSDENFHYVTDRKKFLGMDGGDGLPTVKLTAKEKKALKAMKQRTQSKTDINPTTGVDLGAPDANEDKH